MTMTTGFKSSDIVNGIGDFLDLKVAAPLALTGTEITFYFGLILHDTVNDIDYEQPFVPFNLEVIDINKLNNIVVTIINDGNMGTTKLFDNYNNQLGSTIFWNSNDNIVGYKVDDPLGNLNVVLKHDPTATAIPGAKVYFVSSSDVKPPSIVITNNEYLTSGVWLANPLIHSGYYYFGKEEYYLYADPIVIGLGTRVGWTDPWSEPNLYTINNTTFYRWSIIPAPYQTAPLIFKHNTTEEILATKVVKDINGLVATSLIAPLPIFIDTTTPPNGATLYTNNIAAITEYNLHYESSAENTWAVADTITLNPVLNGVGDGFIYLSDGTDNAAFGNMLVSITNTNKAIKGEIIIVKVQLLNKDNNPLPNKPVICSVSFMPSNDTIQYYNFSSQNFVACPLNSPVANTNEFGFAVFAIDTGLAGANAGGVDSVVIEGWGATTSQKFSITIADENTYGAYRLLLSLGRTDIDKQEIIACVVNDKGFPINTMGSTELTIKFKREAVGGWGIPSWEGNIWASTNLTNNSAVEYSISTKSDSETPDFLANTNQVWQGYNTNNPLTFNTARIWYLGTTAVNITAEFTYNFITYYSNILRLNQ